MAAHLEQGAHGLRRIDVVVDHQHAQGVGARRRGRLGERIHRRFRQRRRGLRQRQPHREAAALPGPAALGADPAAVQLDQALDQVQADAQPALRHRVAVEAALQGEEVAISVIDNGIGIGPEVLPHVFDMYVQAHDGHAMAQGGLGVGLNLVKRLVELHGG
ncbi:MAG: ATP-binding protein, partial [Variovorax sp.]